MVRKPYPGQAASPSGGVLGYDDIRALAIHAGADPSEAGIMARIALAESSGDPRSNANHKTSYVENGKTYYPEGLWQISTVHGTGGGSMFSALSNARQAVQLFKAQGFAPWEASRHGGAGGGWGQYLQSELGPNARGFDTGGGSGGGANEQLYAGMSGSRLTADQVMAGNTPTPASGGRLSADQVMAGASPSPTSTPDGSGRLTADQVMAGATASPHYQTAGISDLPKRAVKDIKALVSNRPVERGTLLAHTEATLAKNWDWAARHPMASLFNVLGTSSRMGMAVTSDLAEHKPGAILKDLWHSVWDASDAYTTKLTAGTQSAMHMPTHQAVDKFIAEHVPKPLQSMASAVAKGSEDFVAQGAVDPLTYSGFGDVVKGAELLKYIHPMFAGGRVALQAWKVADAMGAGKFFTHLRTLSGTYDELLKSFGQAKDYFTVRPDLDVLSPETKAVRMQIEGRGRDTVEDSLTSSAKALKGADPDQAKQIFLKWFAEHGSPKNAAAARRMLPKGEKVVPSNTLKEANVKDALSEFMHPAFEGETPEAMYGRRVEILKKMGEDVTRGQARTQTEAYIQRFGTDADKKIDVSKLGMGDRTAGTMNKALEDFPLLRILRNWQRNAIKWNPLPHAVKNVGQLAFLAGGPEAVVRGLVHGAAEVSGDALTRLKTMGAAAPEYAYGAEHGLAGTLRGATSGAMVRIENGWRQGLLDILDRQKPTRWGTEFEEKDELLKGALINDRLGDYRNQAAFVRLFESLGGPFVAFRMGIVPRNVMLAIKEHPARVLGIARAQYDLNENRRQRQANELEFSGPEADFAKGATNLPAFAYGTLGLPDFMAQSQGFGESWSHEALHTAGQYVMGASALTDAARIATGVAMPGRGSKNHQPMTLPDQIAVSVLMALGMYFHAKPLAKTEQSRKSEIDKRGF